MNKKIFMTGLIASMAMAMVEMVYEGLFGVGFWSAPVFIAATLIRNYQAVALPVTFVLIPVLVGMIGHMMNSVVLDSVFVKIMGSINTTRMSSAGWGSVYGLALFIVMWFGVLPAINPVMLHLNPMVFAFSHIVWGGIIGMMAGKRMA